MATVTYYKRFRMEINLCALPPLLELPDGFVWIPWNEVWLDTHAEVKYQSFRGEIDSVVFPNLSYLDGCLQLMQVIRAKPGFCASATWLIASIDGYCGTVQGVIENGVGTIQNLGVIPECRGYGFGTALLMKALYGFYRVGLTRGALEVTARNVKAMRLYRRLGFYVRRTLYREVETDWIEEDVII